MWGNKARKMDQSIEIRKAEDGKLVATVTSMKCGDVIKACSALVTAMARSYRLTYDDLRSAERKGQGTHISIMVVGSPEDMP